MFYFFLLLFEILVSQRICFINSPSQLICLNEFFFLEEKKIRSIIIIGYPTNNSINQIKSINLEMSFDNKIIYLSDHFRERYFRILIYVIKIILIFKKETIIGDFKYYLSKGFYKYSRKTIFLDEGINFLSIKNSDLNDKYSFFSIFRNKNLQVPCLLNEYSYLKKKINEHSINKNEIYILGTSDSRYGVLKNKYYENLINKICSQNYNKKIIFIPHRNECLESITRLNILNLECKKIDYPIEYYLTKIKILPCIFFGFYSMALVNLKILLHKKPIKIFNISYDIKQINDFKIAELYKRYSNLFSELKIDSFDPNY
jgi:hypothetical protein